MSLFLYRVIFYILTFSCHPENFITITVSWNSRVSRFFAPRQPRLLQYVSQECIKKTHRRISSTIVIDRALYLYRVLKYCWNRQPHFEIIAPYQHTICCYIFSTGSTTVYISTHHQEPFSAKFFKTYCIFKIKISSQTKWSTWSTFCLNLIWLI